MAKIQLKTNRRTGAKSPLWSKNPIKRDGTSYVGDVIVGTSTVDNTFQNGQKTRSVIKDYSGGTLQQERIFLFIIIRLITI